jgi:hypothetical protein
MVFRSEHHLCHQIALAGHGLTVLAEVPAESLEKGRSLGLI